MPYGMYVSAEGAQVQSRMLELISNNLANVDTPGFKRELGIVQARYAEAIRRGTSEAGSGATSDLGGGVALCDTKTDFSTAGVKQTDVPTNLAIDGDGFFQVRKGDETYLTRAGDFRLTARGDLVTPQGYAVMGEGNTPVTIDPAGGPWHIDSEGAIRQVGGTSQQLALVKAASAGDLVKVGENLFRPLAATESVPAAERRVSQGYLELSGVQPTKEMVSMIEASRLLEANVNMIKVQDQMLSELVQRVLRA
jgi:flagellar basal-body rod protein FlgF